MAEALRHKNLVGVRGQGHDDISVRNTLVQKADALVNNFTYVAGLQGLKLDDGGKPIDQFRSHVLLNRRLNLFGKLRFAI